MRAVVFVLLCACNQVYGLDKTVQADPEYYDAPPKPPPVCPALGGSLVFSPVLHQLPLDCKDYNIASDAPLAVGLCREQVFQIYQGPPGGPLTPIAELPRASAEIDIYNPVISPDGTRLFFGFFDLATLASETRAYHRDGTTWIRDANLMNMPPNLSTISRGPDARMVGTNGTSDLFELSDASGTWKTVRTHTRATLGVPSIGAIWLSPDALRIVFVADAYAGPEMRYVAYSDRATKDDAFGAARLVPLPTVDDLFITEDCGRVYFSGLRSVFYADQP